MKELRPYQQECLDNIRAFFDNRNGSGAVIVCQPTGTGKTVIFSSFCRCEKEEGRKVLVVTDRRKLQGQTGNELSRWGLIPRYISSGSRYIGNGDVYVAMSQTLRRRLNEGGIFYDFVKNDIDTIIIDECHIQEFSHLFKGGFSKNKKVLGFTATPRRGGKSRQLALDYTKIIDGISVPEAILQGYLMNCDYYDTASPDMSGVQIDKKKGDFSAKGSFSLFNKTHLYDGLLENYSKLCPNSKTIIFCVNQIHAAKTAIELDKAGADVRYITSGMSEPQLSATADDVERARFEEKKKTWDTLCATRHLTGRQESVFEWFRKKKAGTFSVLINVDIATKGYDCPDIQSVILNRATLSPSLFLQMLGRGARISEGKTHFTVLDFGGNRERHGNYDAQRDWSLWHDEVTGQGIPMMKDCGTKGGYPIEGSGFVKKGCKRLIPISYMICPFCGFAYTQKKKFKRVELALTGRTDKEVKRVGDMRIEEIVDYHKKKGHPLRYLADILLNKVGVDQARKILSSIGYGRIEIDKALPCKMVL